MLTDHDAGAQIFADQGQQPFNRTVALFGIKDIGHLGDIGTAKTLESYRVGDRVGIFSILFMSDHEVILADSDKHLDAKVSVCKIVDGQKNAVAVSTVAHTHNLLGRIYLLFVGPVHKLIMPSLLARSTYAD